MNAMMRRAALAILAATVGAATQGGAAADLIINSAFPIAMEGGAVVQPPGGFPGGLAGSIDVRFAVDLGNTGPEAVRARLRSPVVEVGGGVARFFAFGDQPRNKEVVIPGNTPSMTFDLDYGGIGGSVLNAYLAAHPGQTSILFELTAPADLLPVPEPTTTAMLAGAGAVGLAGLGRSRLRRAGRARRQPS